VLLKDETTGSSSTGQEPLIIYHNLRFSGVAVKENRGKIRDEEYQSGPNPPISEAAAA
jgi:hypothetical protein